MKEKNPLTFERSLPSGERVIISFEAPEFDHFLSMLPARASVTFAPPRPVTAKVNPLLHRKRLEPLQPYNERPAPARDSGTLLRGMTFEEVLTTPEDKLPSEIRTILRVPSYSHLSAAAILVANRMLCLMGLGNTFTDLKELLSLCAKIAGLYHLDMKGIDSYPLAPFETLERLRIPDLSKKLYHKYYGTVYSMSGFFDTLERYTFYAPEGLTTKGLDALQELADFSRWLAENGDVFRGLENELVGLKPGRDIEEAKALTEQFRKEKISFYWGDDATKDFKTLLALYGTPLTDQTPRTLAAFRLKSYQQKEGSSDHDFVSRTVFLEGVTLEGACDLYKDLKNTIDSDTERFSSGLSIIGGFSDWQTALLAAKRSGPEILLCLGLTTIADLQSVTEKDIKGLLSIIDSSRYHDARDLEEKTAYFRWDKERIKRYAAYAKRFADAEEHADEYFWAVEKDYGSFEKLMELPVQPPPTDAVRFVWKRFPGLNVYEKILKAHHLKNYELISCPLDIIPDEKTLKAKSLEFRAALKKYKQIVGKPIEIQSYSFISFVNYMNSYETDKSLPSPFMFKHISYPSTVYHDILHNNNEERETFSQIRTIEDFFGKERLEKKTVTLYAFNELKKIIAIAEERKLDKELLADCLLIIHPNWWLNFSTLLEDYIYEPQALSTTKRLLDTYVPDNGSGAIALIKERLPYLLTGLFDGEFGLPQNLLSAVSKSSIKVKTLRSFFEGRTPKAYWNEEIFSVGSFFRKAKRRWAFDYGRFFKELSAYEEFSTPKKKAQVSVD